MNIGEGGHPMKMSLLSLTQKSALKMVNICKFENFSALRAALVSRFARINIIYYLFHGVSFLFGRERGVTGVSWGSWDVLRGPTAVWDHEHRFQ